MTPADFKTAHEYLGLTTDYLAKRIGVSIGRIWAYEHPERTAHVPDHAAAVIDDLLLARQHAAQKLASWCIMAGYAAIPRYRDQIELEQLVDGIDGWGPLAQGLIIADAQHITGLPVEWVA